MSIFSLITIILASLALIFLIIGGVYACNFHYKMEDICGNIAGFMLIALIFEFFFGAICYAEYLEDVIVKREQLSKQLIITNNSNSQMVYNVKVETVFISCIDTIILKPNETKELKAPEGGFKIINSYNVDDYKN